ncbi:hypothetical protein CANCADRAFT_2218 [Tortispora caseinolytica NRRL Y-17796]|uniref:Uncharacterized protein n=1 Tax=Tortispora caseinolytica NRRL Y-17796 TaxID=767744 RepID=A0A1E4TFD9_9ASCO|nr:hypothetical protein CANCADRAFT_2218 [Tortispora caseinolytica NRRL Y-17796]
MGLWIRLLRPLVVGTILLEGACMVVYGALEFVAMKNSAWHLCTGFVAIVNSVIALYTMVSECGMLVPAARRWCARWTPFLSSVVPYNTGLVGIALTMMYLSLQLLSYTAIYEFTDELVNIFGHDFNNDTVAHWFLTSACIGLFFSTVYLILTVFKPRVREERSNKHHVQKTVV